MGLWNYSVCGIGMMGVGKRRDYHKNIHTNLVVGGDRINFAVKYLEIRVDCAHELDLSHDLRAWKHLRYSPKCAHLLGVWEYLLVLFNEEDLTKFTLLHIELLHFSPRGQWAGKFTDKANLLLFSLFLMSYSVLSRKSKFCEILKKLKKLLYQRNWFTKKVR